MQVLFAALVLVLASLVFLAFLAVPRLRRHALKAVAAVFGFAAGSIGSIFVALTFEWFSGYNLVSLPGWPGLILDYAFFYGGGILGAWLAVCAAGWAQARVLRSWKSW